MAAVLNQDDIQQAIYNHLAERASRLWEQREVEASANVQPGGHQAGERNALSDFVGQFEQLALPARFHRAPMSLATAIQQVAVEQNEQPRHELELVRIAGGLVIEASKQLIALDAFTRRRQTARRQVHRVVEKTFAWFKQWVEAGNAGENQLILNGKQFLVGWSPGSGLVVRPIEKMTEVTRVNLEERRQEALKCLEETLQQAGLAGRDMQMAAVWGALQAYVDPEKELPPGVSDMIITFLARTAACQAWEALAAQDARVPSLLLGYYLTEDTLNELGQQAGGISAGRVSQLVTNGVAFLWDRLPGESLKNEKEFPKEQLRRGRSGRGSDAHREAALIRWETATPEERMNWLEAIDQGASAPEARDKQREQAQRRIANPEHAPEIKAILAEGRRQRWAARN